MEYNNHNKPIRWQILTSIQDILQHFALGLTVFEIFTFKNTDLQNIGRIHDV